MCELSCQVVPPGLPGYAPSCPYTRGASPGGGWSAPDLVARPPAGRGLRHARCATCGCGDCRSSPHVTHYAGAVLPRLGYHVRVHVFPTVTTFFNYVDDSRHHAQVGVAGWIADFLTPSSFFEPFLCSQLRPQLHAQRQHLAVLRPGGGRRHTPPPLRPTGRLANARWAALDRRVLAAQAPAVPLFNRRGWCSCPTASATRRCTGQLGPLLDQFWVR